MTYEVRPGRLRKSGDPCLLVFRDGEKIGIVAEVAANEWKVREVTGYPKVPVVPAQTMIISILDLVRFRREHGLDAADQKT